MRTPSKVAVLWPFLILPLLIWSPFGFAAEDRILTGGWSLYPPYAYIEDTEGITRWKGLDVELLQEIAKRAGYYVESPAVELAQHVNDIRSGKRDVAAASNRTPERAEFAHFSIPYRSEETVLIVPRGGSETLPATTAAELVDLFKRTNFRLGIDQGTAYPSAEFNSFVADQSNSDQIAAFEEKELLQSLFDGRIDGFLSDRIVAAAMIQAAGMEAAVEEHPLIVRGDLHLMFSKASVSPEVVDDFDRAIESVHQDGTFHRLNELYAFPVLVRLTLHSRWFMIADIVGTIAFALSGLLLATRYKYDIFGAFVLASLPAVGGGIVRDLVTNRETLAVLSSPIYLQLIGALVLAGFAGTRIAMALQDHERSRAFVAHIARRRAHFGSLVEVFDAIGLAAFTVTGVVVALATQSSPLWIWGPILAAVTAAGGGILRDVVRSDPDVPSLKGELYPEIAVAWGAILSVYFILESRHLSADHISLSIALTFVGAFVTRMAVIYFGIKSPRFSA